MKTQLFLFYLGCHVIKRSWSQFQFEGSLDGSLRFTAFIQLILKDASSVSFASFNHPQSFAHIPIYEKEPMENESALSLSEFIKFSEMKAYMLFFVLM